MHIKSFELKNFKRFNRLEVNNTGQFNLIVGDNNVGKTTLLEALLISKDPSETIEGLTYSLQNRMVPSDINDLQSILNHYITKGSYGEKVGMNYTYNDESLNANIEMCCVALESLTENELETLQKQILINSKRNVVLSWLINNQHQYLYSIKLFIGEYFPIVAVNIGYGNDLVDFYSKTVQKSASLKLEFIENLNLFTSNISDIEISTELDKNGYLIARINNADEVMPITMFGEGTVKLFRILLEIMMCKGNRLMIDEIDTGIHHSRFKIFWKTILRSALKNNVQIFATTHSKECLAYFKEVLEEEGMQEFKKESRCIRLVNTGNEKVKAVTYDFEQFQFALDHENEIR